MQILKVIGRRLGLAVIGSVLFGLLSYFQWSLIDEVTPFGLVFIWIPIGALFFLSVIASITCFASFRKIKLYVLIPLAINAVAFFIPYTRMWVSTDFAKHKIARDTIVAAVEQGRLTPNVEEDDQLIALDDSYPVVSMGGNEIVVEEHDGNKYVLFFTFRGLLDNYSGFLHVPVGGNPSVFWNLKDAQSSEIVPYGDNWYWTSHH